MFAVLISTLLAAGIAAGVYLYRERLGATGAGMAALRTGALAALALLLFNPARTERVRGGAPTVLLDASLSMGARGGHWAQARDTALALAGEDGTVLRFGAEVGPFDSFPPVAGATRLGDALRVAAARSGPIIVVTDGAVEDADGIAPALARGVKLVLVPRDSIPDAALMDVAVEPRAQRGDSIAGTVLISTVGPLTETTARLEILEGTRRLALLSIPLPPPPGIARRPFVVPARQLDAGPHVLRFEMTVAGDSEPGDNTRLRLVTISEQPSVVLLVSPSDWEGRFLAGTIGEVAHTTVRGFAQIRADRWVDMRTLAPVSATDIRSAVRGAALVVARGDVSPEMQGWRGPVWRWPAGTDLAAQAIPGEWYINHETPSSPVGGRLASVEWDSVPPIDGLIPQVMAAGDWVGLSGRLGRRGADRPVLVGRDTLGVRMLTTTAHGLYRWGLRGGASREAYRAIVAAGTDWLLGADAIRRASALASTDVVTRGIPVTFRWGQTPVPDSTIVSLTRGDTTAVNVLRFDAEGTARVPLEPGTWRWNVVGGPESGLAVVEEYSDEFRVRPVTFSATGEGEAFSTVERRPREWWWVFVLAVVAFCGEWAWRLRRGLP